MISDPSHSESRRSLNPSCGHFPVPEYIIGMDRALVGSPHWYGTCPPGPHTGPFRGGSEFLGHSPNPSFHILDPLDCINPNPLDVSGSQRGLQSLFASLKSQIHGNSGSKDRDEYLLSTAMCKKLYTRHLFNPKRAYEEDTVILSCLSYK